MKKFFVLIVLGALLTGCAGSTETTPADTSAVADIAQAEVIIPDEAVKAVPVAQPAIPATNDASATKQDSTGEGKLYDGYAFSYNGAPVYLGDEMVNVLETLGPETEFYEAPSCAFDGMAKMYVYGGFETATYIKDEGDTDKLYSITFFDDSVTTAEGIYIGQTYDDMVAAYGEDYEEIVGSYLYNKDGAVLSFTVEDNVITVIQYYIEDIYG